MRISRQVVYGLGCLLEVAKAKDKPLTIGEISFRQGLSKDYVEQLLIRLKRKNLIKSIRGLRGGYILAKDPHLITLKDVIEAEERKILDLICFKEDKTRCNFKNCQILPMWLNLKDRIGRSLERIKISDLLKKKRQLCR
jgi:Rrf2 family iron-sulfur cluster assembly transcriptional regulator